MVSTFQKSTYALNLAKRKEAKEIAANYDRQLTEERASKLEVEKELVQGRQREQLLQDELKAQKAAVEAYRAQLASRIQVGAQPDAISPSTTSNTDN
jgi:FixJ family two-component response regulator